ncbi:MAG TPA: outer membrane protein assembly factor BamB [Gammaproteobacteria bacterium]|nr:outer membrane protein assembly factor BamB [Gammaproteobacteria bacterium]HIK69508.1 outer membrane protein assembly factor BamB [Pseudomonadales bacterium]
MKYRLRQARILLPLLLLSSCSWFGDKEEEINKPAELRRFVSELDIVSLWSRKVGGGAEDKAIRLEPAIAGSRVFAASASGTVMALQAGNGRPLWQRQVKDFYVGKELKNAFAKDVDVITGGVGVGADLVLVGTAAGDVVALFQSDGSLAWRSRVSSEVLAPPQAIDDLIVAQTIDGKVAGFDALSGERKWIFSTSIPSLTLRGTSTPLVGDGVVIAGFSNGRVALIDPIKGVAAIDERIATAMGRSDLERLVDIDGRMIFTGGRLYVASYQGRLVAIDLNAGRPLWSEEASSVVGLGSGFGNVYLAHDDDRITAMDMDNGRVQWDIEALLNRDVTVPVATGSYVALGDFEGYLHIIAQSDGRFVARRRVDSAGIFTPIVSDGSRLYVMGNSGKLFAFEIR